MIELRSILFSFPASLLAIGVIVAVHLAIKKQRARSTSRKSFTLPGPKALPFFGNSLDLIKSEDIIRDLTRLSKIYGSPYELRIGSHSYVVLSTAEHIELFFRHSKANHKTDLFAKFKDVFGNSIFTAFGDVWKVKRRNLLRTMNGKRLDNFEPIFQEQTKRLIADWKNRQNETIDLWDFLPFLTFSIIAKTNIHPSVEVPVSRNEFKFHEIMKQMFVTNFKRVIHPLYQNDVIAKCAYGKQNSRLRMEVQCLIQQIIPEQKLLTEETENEATSDDMSYARTALLISNTAENPNDFYDDILLALSAGTVNVSVMLGFFLLMMGIYPNIQDKVYTELNDIIDNSKGNINSSDLNQLSYFNQVFKETLRRFTLIPVIFRKLETSLEIDGIIIPEETNIAISVADAHFNSKYWKDPWNFNPENFDEELSKMRPKYSYIPFAAGPRDCLGKMYAELEMKIILVSLLREFKFSTSTKIDDIKLNYSFLVSNLDGYKVNVERRKKRGNKK